MRPATESSREAPPPTTSRPAPLDVPEAAVDGEAADDADIEGVLP